MGTLADAGSEEVVRLENGRFKLPEADELIRLRLLVLAVSEGGELRDLCKEGGAFEVRQVDAAPGSEEDLSIVVVGSKEGRWAAGGGTLPPP